MVAAGEHVAVDIQRHARVRVAQLPTNELRIDVAADQQRGIAVAERVQRQPTRRSHAYACDRPAEHVSDAPIVLPALDPRSDVEKLSSTDGIATMLCVRHGPEDWAQRVHDRPLSTG